ncbi:DUF3152 domain-containing protein [Streptomyces sp. NPDC059063]|uniref:DUF3152 domain-containing protein n=1 Tax=unclassified Streptomyces TaxID=2593676 RepID=UPI0036AD3F9C
MGRHSRRGPADNSDTSSTSGIPKDRAQDTGKGAAQGAPGGIPKARAAEAGPGSGRRRRDTPPHGVPRAQATPPHGIPQPTPPGGVPRVRGGHPEQREAGGGWGEVGGGAPGARPEGVVPPQARPPRTPGPRQDYVEAFDGLREPRADEDALGLRTPPPRDPYASVTAWDAEEPDDGDDEGAYADDSGAPARVRRRGRTVTGIAAAAVTTVLAIVVAGQVADDGKDSDAHARSAKGDAGDRDADGSASRSDNRPTPADSARATPATYDEKMGKKYPLDAKLAASGHFQAMPGFDKAPGKGQKFRYRVDVEKGMGLDGELFAQAVQKTLNDDRSWAHGGARTFERISSGKPDFVITLASPVTTAKWCAKSGLDTLQQNVSCDSSMTDRIMINAYRWAQGAKTYGDHIHPYRQMLINHEVGHRLGHGHVDCQRDGELAPVMQQQTKFLEHDGIRCKPNPWAFPKG